MRSRGWRPCGRRPPPIGSAAPRSPGVEAARPLLAASGPYYLPQGDEAAVFATCHERRLAVLLKGPTGCGKTRFVEHMAWRLGRPLITVACHDDLAASDLLGRYLIREGATVWQDGPLTRAVREGAICYLDEVVEARQDTIVVIHALTDHRRLLTIDKTGESIEAPPGFQLVVSYNPAYQHAQGSEAEHAAALRRPGERDAGVVGRRIAALEPDRHTRVGAALRHATARLARRRERHRLLLLLSDGKPNDVDVYEGRYGVEDARQAVIEARAEGIHAFCLAIDRAAPRYAARMFGPGGYATLAHARELPTALVELLRGLIGR